MVKLYPLREIQSQYQRTVGSLCGERFRFLLAEAFSRRTVVFQSPQHPHLIVRVDGSSRFRVHSLQLGVHGFRAFFGQFCRQLFPQAVRCFFFCKADSIQKALDIKAGTAHQNGQRIPGKEFLFQLSGHCAEIRHTEQLIRCPDIHPVVRDAVGLFQRYLGRTHIQPFIDLHGVCADDFAAKALRQCDAQCSFSGGGRAYNSQHRMSGFIITQCGQTAFPAPSGSI